LNMMMRRCRTPVHLLLLVISRCSLCSWLTFLDFGLNKGLSCKSQSVLQSCRSCESLMQGVWVFLVSLTLNDNGIVEMDLDILSSSLLYVSSIAIIRTFFARSGSRRSLDIFDMSQEEIVSAKWTSMTLCRRLTKSV
jgi:hypothetical protein